MLNPHSCGGASELLQSNLAKRSAGLPVEASEDHRKRVTALSDEKLMLFATRHGVGFIQSPFDREDLVEQLMAAGLGSELDFRGMIA